MNFSGSVEDGWMGKDEAIKYYATAIGLLADFTPSGPKKQKSEKLIYNPPIQTVGGQETN